MLSEKIQLLLSASVDGVLSAAEREAADRLLRESAEARALVRKLTENVTKIKSLPRKTLDPNFPARIVASLPLTVPMAVETTPLETVTAAPFEALGDLVHKPRLRRAMPTWMVGGIAASLVGAVVLGGLVWLRGQLDDKSDPIVADSGKLPIRVKPAPKLETPSPVDDLVAQIARGAGERYGEVEPKLVAAPNAQPIRYAFGELQKQNSFDSLKWELAHTPSAGVHLDVSVKYNARSLNRIIESFHKQGIQLVVTPSAESSVSKKQPLLVYAENVQADKLALALRELSEIDIQGKTKEASTFVAVRVSPDSADDHTRISQGLGIESRQLKSPATPVPQVSAVGVVLPAERTANPASVREIRGFLAGRGPVRIGTLQVFLHLQPTEK